MSSAHGGALGSPSRVHILTLQLGFRADCSGARMISTARTQSQAGFFHGCVLTHLPFSIVFRSWIIPHRAGKADGRRLSSPLDDLVLLGGLWSCRALVRGLRSAILRGAVHP